MSGRCFWVAEKATSFHRETPYREAVQFEEDNQRMLCRRENRQSHIMERNLLQSFMSGRLGYIFACIWCATASRSRGNEQSSEPSHMSGALLLCRQRVIISPRRTKLWGAGPNLKKTTSACSATTSTGKDISWNRRSFYSFAHGGLLLLGCQNVGISHRRTPYGEPVQLEDDNQRMCRRDHQREHVMESKNPRDPGHVGWCCWVASIRLTYTASWSYGGASFRRDAASVAKETTPLIAGIDHGEGGPL